MLFRKTLVPVLAVVLFLGVSAAANADTSKPLAVVAFSGYSKLKNDIAYIGKISGQPNLATNLEFLAKLVVAQGKDFRGLDKDRPWGAVIQLDEEKLAAGVQDPKQLLSGYVFLPVTDLDALLATFEKNKSIGKPESAGNGVLKVGKAPNPGFVKQIDDWACLAAAPEALADIPPDPAKSIAELVAQYDLAFRVNLAAVPDAIRSQAVGELRRQGKENLKRRPGESEEEYMARKIVGEYFLNTATTLAKDLEQVTFGWALDHEQEKAYVDIVMSALPETSSARQFATLAESTTDFGGFVHPEATVAWNWTGKLPEIDSSNLAVVIDTIRAKAMDDLQNQRRSPKETELGRKLVNGFLDVIQKTIETSRIDGGGSVTLSPDAVTVVTGGYVADGARLEETLGTVVEAVRMENPAFAKQAIKMDAGKEAGVKFHTVSIPVPADADDRGQLVRMIGEDIDVVVGVGDQSVYLAVGRDPMEAMREVIRKSEHERATTVAPLRVSVALEALTTFVAKVGDEKDRAEAAAFAALLQDAVGKDHVNIVATAIDRGVQFRLELEQGILEAIGKAAQQKRQGNST